MCSKPEKTPGYTAGHCTPVDCNADGTRDKCEKDPLESRVVPMENWDEVGKFGIDILEPIRSVVVPKTPGCHCPACQAASTGRRPHTSPQIVSPPTRTADLHRGLSAQKQYYCGRCSGCYRLERWTHLVSLRRLLARVEPDAKYSNPDAKQNDFCMWRQHGPKESRGIQEPEVKPATRLSEMVPLAGFLYLSVPEVTLPASGKPAQANDGFMLEVTSSLAGHFAPDQ